MSASTISDTVVIANEVHMPRIGLGTFRARGEECRTSVVAALGCGIRHIDTASVYKNEADVGWAIAHAMDAFAIQRKDVFITSKVSPYEQGTNNARAAVEASLRALGVRCGTPVSVPAANGRSELYTIA